MHRTLHFEQKAMATLFEGWLCGEDIGHLRSVAQALQEEIMRIEQLLSRYDSQAELFRLNNAHAKQPIKVERELWAVLENCLGWYARTDGYFDIGVYVSSSSKAYAGLADSLSFYKESYQIEFAEAGVSLDLGGYGKGYALDKLSEILDRFGVHDFMLHGGKSSFLAQGYQANGKDWQVHVISEKNQERACCSLVGGMSYSSVCENLRGISGIVHVQTGKSLQAPLSCVVWSPSALEAEVLSTTLLAMGREQGETFMQKEFPQLKVQFLEKQTYEA